MNKKNRLLPINHEYSVSSGVFAGVNDGVYMKLDKYGQYRYQIDSKLDKAILEKFNKVDIMSDYSENEDVLSDRLFSNISGIKFSNNIGYYVDLYAGYVNESTFRSIATSGGFGTWILSELLKRGEVDGVIHPHSVDPEKNDGILFKYQISRTQKEIKKGAKTRYYPMELSEVLREVKQKPGRYAVVGISEFITELRLLCEQEKIFKERLVYMIGLINNHQKTTKYAEALAWEQGIEPGDLREIDFRVKSADSMAWDYKTKFHGYKDGKETIIVKNIGHSPIQHWNMGFFKSKFSDFTDNVFNELADISLGDAWLQEYAKDPRGTNILIVRNRKLALIIKEALKAGRVKLDRLSENKIISSQGMISHTKYELPYRLFKSMRQNEYTPIKRVSPNKNIPFFRKRVQDLRRKIMAENGLAYEKSVALRDFNVYKEFINKYNSSNIRLYKQIDRWERIADHTVSIGGKIRKVARDLLLKMRVIEKMKKLRTRFYKVLGIVENRKVDGAIISLCDDFNYGNIMQRYALQTYLRGAGLDFIHLAIYTRYLQSVRDSYLQNSLREFTDKYIKMNIFDAVKSVGYRNYIVGSDQVWRNHGTDDVERDYMPYWLEFLGRTKSNRISYAASFGVGSLSDARIDFGLADRIRPLMSKFSAISLREESGRRLVDEIAGDKIKTKVTLDPTLLLSAEDYSTLIDGLDPRRGNTFRVFSYILDPDDIKIEIIKKISKEYGSNYTIIGADPRKKLEPVEEWLRGFRDASFIVTDSFHGAVFAIINNKDFIVFSNIERGLDRMANLLKQLGIEDDRLVVDAANLNFDHLKLKPIKWSRVNKKLHKLRLQSSEWLLSSIKS